MNDYRSIGGMSNVELNRLIEDINNTFSKIEYRGATLNSFLGDFIYIDLVLRRLDEKAKQNFLLNRIPFLYYFLKFAIYSKLKSLKNRTRKIGTKGRYLFSWSNIKEYCALLVLPVVSNFSPGSVAIVGNTHKMEEYLAQESNFNKYEAFFY